MLGRGALVVDQREAVAVAAELHPAGFVVAEAQARVRRDRRVEAPRPIEVADADPEVVDAAGRRAKLGFAVKRLDAVAVGVEQEGAVVVRVVRGARSRRSVAAVAGVDPGLPEGVDGRAVGSAEADVKAAGHRMLAIGRDEVPVLPLDQLGVAHAPARRRAPRARSGRSARRHRGRRRRSRRGRTSPRSYPAGPDSRSSPPSAIRRAPRPRVRKLNDQRTKTSSRFWKPIRYQRWTKSQVSQAGKPLSRSDVEVGDGAGAPDRRQVALVEVVERPRRSPRRPARTAFAT